MRNRKLYKFITVMTALGMITVSPMTALAETVEYVNIEGAGSKEVEAVSNDKAEAGVSMTDGTGKLDGSVTVTGDVTVSNKNASGESYSQTNGVSIVSNGGKATVNVGGNVTADASQNDDSSLNANGVSTGANSTIDIGGSVVSSAKAEGAIARGVYSGAGNADPEYKADIHIGKDINVSSENGPAFGVYIRYNATGSTTVDGNIDASGMFAHGIYIYSCEEEYKADKNIDISVGGDLKAKGTVIGNGVYVAENNKDLNITVEGNITGSNSGIFVGTNTGNAKIVSGGTVSSKNAAIVVYEPSDEGEKSPEITVWKIESGSDSLVEGLSSAGKKSDSYTETIAKSINYIIKADATENGVTSSKGTIVLKAVEGELGSVKIGDKTYKTANQDQEIIINVETKKGYKSTVQNNGAGTLTVNADGSYTLTIPAGGGVDLRAVLEKIEEQRKSSSTRNSDRYSSGSSQGGSLGITPNIIYNESWSYDNNGWKLKKPDGNFANGEWRQVSWNGINSWYHFNSNGYADGGWFTDTDGQRYYFYNNHDGAFGRMLTGWNEIDGQWYYFNTIAVNGGSLGSLVTDGTTPDGYKVDASGAWVN